MRLAKRRLPRGMHQENCALIIFQRVAKSASFSGKIHTACGWSGMMTSASKRNGFSLFSARMNLFKSSMRSTSNDDERCASATVKKYVPPAPAPAVVGHDVSFNLRNLSMGFAALYPSYAGCNESLIQNLAIKPPYVPSDAVCERYQNQCWQRRKYGPSNQNMK